MNKLLSAALITIAMAAIYNCIVSKPAMASDTHMQSGKDTVQVTEAEKKLQKYRASLEDLKHRKKELDSSLSAIEKEMNQLSERAVNIANTVQKYEKRLLEIEDELDSLDELISKKQHIVDERSKQISQTLGTIIRMQRVPIASAAVMPQGIQGKIRAARALGIMSESMKEEVNSLLDEMDEISRLQQEMSIERERLRKYANQLIAESIRLRHSIEKRKRLMSKLRSEDIKQQQEIAALLKKSTDLQSFIKNMENAREEYFNKRFDNVIIPILKPQHRAGYSRSMFSVIDDDDNTRAVAKHKRKGNTFSKGRLKMPAVGRISVGFGGKRNKNDTSKGIEIITRKNARIVAPFEGEVVFADKFLGYKYMVIIRHSSRYLTLISGMKAVDCVAGQFLLEGEPIGVMGEGIEEQKLYIELRKDGKAINPQPWFSS